MVTRRLRRTALGVGVVVGLVVGSAWVGILFSSGAAGAEEKSLEVRASAYNSVPGQTANSPALTAWGDELRPGVKSIAVSRDLIELGLGHGTLVRIDGLSGKYKVLDKMAKRWTRKIDVYMGDDVEAARRWGVRTVMIHWNAP